MRKFNVIFELNKDILRTVSFGKTLTKLGVIFRRVFLENNRYKSEDVKAKKYQRFNRLALYRDGGGVFYRFHVENGLKHADFVSVYKFSQENPAEFLEMVHETGSENKVVEWIKQDAKICHFTEMYSRQYKIAGKNTFYLSNGEMYPAKGKVIHITVGSRRCRGCVKDVIEYFYIMPNGYCPECVENMQECTSCNEPTIGKRCNSCQTFYNGNIRSYGDKAPKFWFFEWIKGKLIKKEAENSGLSKREKQLYIGDEHEVECSEDRSGTAEYITAEYRDEMFYTTSDGSLENGFEMHTHPSTHKTHSKRNWEGIKKIREWGSSSHHTSTAGLHFHLNRSAFSNWHFLKFIKFINENIALTLAVARRRNIDNLNEYARFEFRFFNDLKRSIARQYKREPKNTAMTVQYGGRGAINMSCSKTVELRFFGGALTESHYKAKIDYVQAVFEYSYNSSLKSQNVMEFKRFVMKNKNRFRHLVKQFQFPVYERAFQFPHHTPENLSY